MAKDIIHNAVKNALIKDRWTITHDPLTLEYKDKRVFADLGAERVVAAERNGEKIAVEIKSFLGRSIMDDLKVALGQYILYESFLAYVEPDRKVYLAISDLAYSRAFENSEAIQMLLERNKVSLFVVDIATEEVIEWIQN